MRCVFSLRCFVLPPLLFLSGTVLYGAFSGSFTASLYVFFVAGAAAFFLLMLAKSLAYVNVLIDASLNFSSASWRTQANKQNLAGFSFVFAMSSRIGIMPMVFIQVASISLIRLFGI